MLRLLRPLPKRVLPLMTRCVHTQQTAARLQHNFHKSWFCPDPQTPTSVTSALFSATNADQLRSFETHGYALIKRADAQCLVDISQVHADVMALMARKTASGWYYSLLRFFNLSGQYSVRSPDRRYSIPLPADLLLLRVLSAGLRGFKPLLSSQLGSNASLVDLSSIISFPGSHRQKTHSDVPHSTRHRIISGFMALSRVTIESGPTCLFSGTNTAAFHRRHVGEAGQAMHKSCFYSSSEESSTEEEAAAMAGTGSDSGEVASIERPATARETAEETRDIDRAAAAAPAAALLEAGDVLIYDSCLFHYGGANVSAVPRALLMFSFQESTPWGTYEEVTGFTYNFHSSVKGKFALHAL